MRQLSVAATVLVLLMGPTIFLQYRHAVRSSGRSPGGQPTGDQPRMIPKVLPGKPDGIAPWIDKQVLIRRRTWEIVSRFCADREDVARLRERYLAMSATAAREQFSTAFGLRIMYLAAVSLTHLLVYSYLARSVAEDVTSASKVASGWWATLPLFVSSALALLIISLISSRPKVVIFAFTCVGSALCLGGIWLRGPGIRSGLGWLALFTGGTLILLAATASIVALAAASIRQKLWTYRATDSHVFADVQMALRYLDADGKALSDLATCGRLARFLETAATCTESGLYRALSLQHAPSSLVVKSRLEGAARRLRSYQTWIALPNAGTARELERELSQFLIVLCCREYDSLPSLAPPGSVIPRGVRKAASTLRTLVIAAVPLALIKGAEWAGVLDSGPISQGLILLSIIWLLAGVFTTADPLLGPHLSAVKDLVGAVRSMGGVK